MQTMIQGINVVHRDIRDFLKIILEKLVGGGGGGKTCERKSKMRGGGGGGGGSVIKHKIIKDSH